MTPVPRPLLALVLLALAAGCSTPGAPPAAGSSAAASASAAPKAGARPRIEKAADLPSHRYPVKGSLETIVRDPVAFKAFVAPLRRDIEQLLAQYEIADKAMQRELMTELAIIDYLEGRPDDTLKRLDAVRALEDKPSDKLTSGMRLRAAALAAKKHAPGTPAHAKAVGDILAAELVRMPYDVVGNTVRELKAGAEMAGEGRVLGRVREVLQPLVDANGALTHETAPAIVFARYALTTTVPLKATWVSTFTTWLDQHRVAAKPDIWAARDVTLPAQGPYRPVTVAVWDSGVDTALFPGRLATDAAGKPLVIGFDKYGVRADSELAPLPPAMKARGSSLLARSKGFSDLQSNIESPEATEVKQWMSTMTPAQYKPAMEELGLLGNYEHGTHVAGIAAEGNPFVRLLTARIEFGHTLKPDPCPSRELALRDADNTRAVVDFFRRHGVKVVNMSWGGSVGDTESELEKCSIGATADARKALARELFDIQKHSLTQAMASAPGILFIAAAGNENQDSGFAESTPADIVLPNLLTVGAVDQAGDEAGFTSYGKTVRLHANGYQVTSFLPGGMRVALSGTSMAAPQAANLAAKLLAAKPSLTPVQLVDLMTRTADRSADGRRVLMNPKKAMAAALAG